MMQRKVGALIFPEFEMLDCYGPLEIFAMFPDAFDIRAVAMTGDPVPASGGPSTLPDDSIDDGVAYDIMLVPGGAGTRTEISNRHLLDWLASSAAQAEIVTSVCTGAALLAAAGVLGGHPATTNKRAFDWVVDTAPDIDWRRRARWVESGNIFTSSGVSAGIDMTLAIVSRLLGEDAAKDAARWAEYIRNSNADDDPFASEKDTTI